MQQKIWDSVSVRRCENCLSISSTLRQWFRSLTEFSLSVSRRVRDDNRFTCHFERRLCENPFMLRAASARTDCGVNNIKYLTVRPELSRRAPVGFFTQSSAAREIFSSRDLYPS